MAEPAEPAAPASQSTPQPPSPADATSVTPSNAKGKGKDVPGREQDTRPSTSDSQPLPNGGVGRPSASSDVATAASTDTDRSRRRRSGLDFRNSPRISELFSGFRHRRVENDSEPSPRSATPPRSSREHIVTPVISPPKPEPPPPKLPPPSLNDLGLAMSVLTGNLNPAHFTSPPTNGTFLAPHYLLLCHAQGLDVLSLISPPAPEPFAIVRRVNFKSVVVMEERGVLIAIAGRRDVVRVYALDELRRVIEWRLDIETRKEKERLRKEEGKKLSGKVDHVFGVTLPPKDELPKSLPTPSANAESKPSTLQPRAPTSGRPRRRLKQPPPMQPRVPSDPPPAYSLTNGTSRPSPSPQASQSASKRPAAVDTRARSASVSTLSPAMATQAQEDEDDHQLEPDVKADWKERDGSSDDEAITIAAAGASGSAALDERTSSRPPESTSMDGLSVTVSHSPPHLRDLHSQSVAFISPTLERANYFRESFPRVTNSDAHTLRPSNRSSLIQSSPLLASLLPLPQTEEQSSTPEPTTTTEEPEAAENNDDDDEAHTPVGEVSLAMMLMESRIPDLPPPGSRTQQQAIFLGSSSQATINEESENMPSTSSPPTPASARSRRRWSILGPASTDSLRERARENAGTPEMRQLAPRSRPQTASNNPGLSRSNSSRVLRTTPSNSLVNPRHLHSSSNPDMNPPLSAPPHSDRRHVSGQHSHSSSSFFPKFISAVLGQRPTNDNSKKGSRLDKDPLQIGPNTAPQPKLDYVKLPGTKGSILIKAVETSRKSFLAILCGESGEKVELFAGTYRTALSLSRTFILPDSPRSLELQVQGDDLVEIFLVFSQNVFGLEPATVRVREVRIGRAERRAARRRARENIASASGNDTPIQHEEDMNVSVSIGVVASETNDSAGADFPDPDGLNNNTGDEPDPQPMQAAPATAPDPEELLAIASAQSIPYSTFQQLSFAPAFPLAILGDDVIIPPSYPSFLRHRAKYESSSDTGPEFPVPVQQFTPPGLPPPRPVQQSRWYYRDPKGVIQGPWKSSLMHSWYKDGLLPLDLPVRRDTDAQFCLLKELRAQSVDPEHPFRSYANQLVVSSTSEATVVPLEAQPLLPPVSLLEQPRHFGPPALFFSSRGGHSTTIVDAKGRSVLKGRFMWSADEASDEGPVLQVKLGDVQRLEAFDVRNRAVIVALRQGGLEAVDVGDALYRPADESRSYIPSFQAPLSGFNRRASYVWRIGGPLTLPASASPIGSRDALGMSIKKASNGGSISVRNQREHLIASEEFEATGQEEVIYLGRKEDDLYLCEKTAFSFRILRLSPS